MAISPWYAKCQCGWKSRLVLNELAAEGKAEIHTGKTSHQFVSVYPLFIEVKAGEKLL